MNNTKQEKEEIKQTVKYSGKLVYKKINGILKSIQGFLCMYVIYEAVKTLFMWH
jgi:hypothetical protein